MRLLDGWEKEEGKENTRQALVGLALCTAALGLVVFALGKARLTFVVSFLPMSVLGVQRRRLAM